jgi:hypothetical protein
MYRTLLVFLVILGLLLTIATVLMWVPFPSKDVVHRASEKQYALTRNLVKVGEAIQEYKVAKGAYPDAAIQDANGNPLLSWRVSLLPFLGESELFDMFRLDEPWDSARNRPLVEKIPAVFRHPGNAILPIPAGNTTLLGIIQKNRFATLTDDDGLPPSERLVVVDCAKSVPWSAPADIDMEQVADPRALCGSLNSRQFKALFADFGVSIVTK